MPAPVITSINPNSVPPGTIPPNTANNAIEINGYFDSTCQVWFNGNTVSISSSTATKINVSYSSGPGPATIAVSVTGIDGTATATLTVTGSGGSRGSRGGAGGATHYRNFVEYPILQYHFPDVASVWSRDDAGKMPGSTQYNFTIYENLGYGTEPGSPLAVNATNLSNAGPAAIITFGGNVAASTMAQYNPGNIPFFSVFGNLTADLAGARYLSGGVNLDTIARNADRFNHLTNDLNIPPSQIAFLSNPGSAMYYVEQAQWAALNPGGPFYQFNPLSFSPPIMSVQQGFDNIFQNFARNSGASAILVSADPAFQNNKSALIASANNSNKMVCYPLQTYNNNSGTLPAAGRVAIHGTKTRKSVLSAGTRCCKFSSDGYEVSCSSSAYAD